MRHAFGAYMFLKPFRAPPDVWAKRSPWIVIALFALAGAAALDDYGVFMDTPDQRSVALATLDYIGGRDNALLSHANRTYGVIFEVSLVWAERLLGLQDSRSIYLMRHLLTHLFFLASGLGCYALAFRLYDSRFLAICAMGMYLLHPRIYAHSFPNSKDIPFLSLFMLALFLLHWAVRRGSVKALLFCGVGVGVLANIRVIGIVLAGGALILQAFNWIHANGPKRRRRAWQSAGGIVLASTLTFYALFPYLWSDPIHRLAEVIRYAAAFPGDSWFMLFRGRPADFQNLPPSYVPVWIAISTPPFVLGLGLLGIGALLFAKRKKYLHDMSLWFRFGLLLCFVLPVLAAILLKSPFYDDWRHLYFLYAPFSLLAAGGLGALIKLARQAGIGQKAAYGFVSVGMLSVLAPAVGLHPYQDAYFNFLVDRATPGYVQTQYFMHKRHTAYRQAAQYMLDRYPDARLYVNHSERDTALQKAILPKRDRPRISFVHPEHADFHIRTSARMRSLAAFVGPEHADFHIGQVTRPLTYAPPIMYTEQAYGLTIFSVVALNLDKAGPAAGSFHRALLRDLETHAPLLRNHFDIYWDGRRLLWIQEPCTRFDGRARFILRVFPVDNLDLPRDRQPWGFDNLAFNYVDWGVRIDQACLAVVPLPTYPIRALRVGQWVAAEKRTLWASTVDFPLAPQTANDYRAAYRALATRLPVRRAPFRVYAATSGITVAKSRCTTADIEPRFIVHVEPFDPRATSGPGFENLDFVFRTRGQHSVRFDDTCLASIRLPDYPIRQVTVAQWHSETNEVLWQAVVTQPFAQTAVQTYRAAFDVYVTAGAPAVRAAFDVYVTADEVAYAKAPCTPADTEPKFILHVLPVHPRDLPPDRQRAGFDNLDFEFAWQGAHFQGRCLALAALPDYSIDRLRVGQFRSGAAAPLWQSEIALDRGTSEG